MNTPDGPEAREAERLAEELAADRRHEAAEARADEDDARDERWSTPVSCVVNGHDDFGVFYCRRCGTPRYASLAIVGAA